MSRPDALYDTQRSRPVQSLSAEHVAPFFATSAESGASACGPCTFICSRSAIDCAEPELFTESGVGVSPTGRSWP
jgi:hypothetical protein